MGLGAGKNELRAAGVSKSWFKTGLFSGEDNGRKPHLRCAEHPSFGDIDKQSLESSYLENEVPNTSTGQGRLQSFCTEQHTCPAPAMSSLRVVSFKHPGLS